MGYEWDDYWIYPPVSSKVAGGKIPYTLEMLTGTSLSILEMGDSTLPCLISNLSRGEHMKKNIYIYIHMYVNHGIDQWLINWDHHCGLKWDNLGQH